MSFSWLKANKPTYAFSYHDWWRHSLPCMGHSVVDCDCSHKIQGSWKAIVYTLHCPFRSNTLRIIFKTIESSTIRVGNRPGRSTGAYGLACFGLTWLGLFSR
ncbi:hypothetical protein MTR_5g028380 [Medicago truncatula]|uniref:Uncharacterized protein n=1 Tax=Medicago truncatula TaxID=3880 RepID=G7KAX0_MEDTR|nr:hypothetical protein MTR_5g028380 [Medicago truncatula]